MLEAAHEAVSSVDEASKEFIGLASRILGELYLSTWRSWLRSCKSRTTLNFARNPKELRIEHSIVLMRIFPTRRDRGLFTFRRHAGEYWTPLLLRSSIVEEQPGFYQFAPCSGFGILQNAKSEVLLLLASEGFDCFDVLISHFCDELFAEPSHARDVTKTPTAPAKDS